MRQFIRAHYQLLVFILLWIAVAALAPVLLYAVLPIGVFLFRRAGRWHDILFGFIMCLVLSDMLKGLPGMDVMKTAKYTYIMALGALLLVDRVRMQPMARVFPIFLPFLVYAFLPLLRSEVPVPAFQKTVSYGLLFLVVPNYVLFNFRRYGWEFFGNLVRFLMFMLLAQQLLPWLDPGGTYYLAGRFKGFFGNPNGMAIFVYLTLMLVVVVNHLRKDLFSRTEMVLYGLLLAYYLITCGARTSLMSALMFLLFIQFFRISMFLGVLSFIAFVGLGELMVANLPAIINALGLHEYLRVETLASGSGRYVAWEYAWHQVQEQGLFLFGAGFDHEFVVMERAKQLLSSMGHQGGAHNTYLVFWMNTGIVGLLFFLRSLFLIFIKAGKNTPVAMAVLFSVLFSILYESWLSGSLNPYTSLLLVLLTIMSEDEIIGAVESASPAQPDPGEALPPPLILPAR
ncbi:MAG: O-antigen ligase family protein [Flavobacteriales bacterium]|nr:O-antigen ligase family protein [Flavobacteriales bacterium]